MSEDVKRLTWKDGQYTTQRGIAGGTELFAVTWKSRRDDPNWLMRSYLPGQTGCEWKHDDKAVLQAKAEELLSAWLESVNGGPLS